MQIYSVGGFVRDTLLRRRGFPAVPGDHDWVVVGETPESMIERGFLPVGEDFPVFLHPKTHEEYALARTERKTAPGYHGFVFHASSDVTLEEDLRRRDLTINAIAMDEHGQLYDPYGGAEDIARGIIRHVSEAFKEDPVRILRVARFAARFPGFSIAPGTMTLMQEMVDSGEADALVPERVLQEFIKGLSAPVPCRMLDVLIECGLWHRLYPEIKLSGTVRARLYRTCREGLPTSLRLAALVSGLPDGSQAKGFLSRLRASAEAQDLAKILGDSMEALAELSTPENVSSFFQRYDAVRRPARMTLLLAFRAKALPEAAHGKAPDALLRAALSAWCGIDAGSIARSAPTPRDIPPRVLAARTEAVAALWPH